MACAIVLCTLPAWSQTTVTLTQGGTLSTLISSPSTVTELHINGPMNDADYLWLRENCRNLTKLDLSGVTTSTMPASALTRTASSATDLTLTIGGQSPRYELADGSRVVFIPTTSTVAASTAAVTALASGATVSPDPTTVTFTDGTPVTFTVTAEDGVTTKTYKYYVTLDDWFTMIVGGDPECGMTRTVNSTSYSVTSTTLTTYFNNMAAMGSGYSDRFSYSTYNYIKPKASIVFSLGDMDADHADFTGESSKTTHSVVRGIFQKVIDAGIPLITLFGNHDWTPESWGNSSYGCDYSDNSYNKGSVNVMKDFVTKSAAVSDPITNVQYFTTSSGDIQPSPFTFRFHNVQFFMAGNYWFQCPYTASIWAGGSNTSGRTFYAPDDIISSLQSYITNTYDKTKPAIWMQHFPLAQGSDIERWWMNWDANSSAPFSSGLTTSYGTYATKLAEYEYLISQTTKPAHFSGHMHIQGTKSFTKNNGTSDVTFTDYTCPYEGAGLAYLVLVRESEGVKEVKSVSFNY
jgi:hypothetical protein